MTLEKRDVPGYEGRYHLDPETMSVINSKTGRALKPRIDGAGYCEVQLWKNNERKHKTLHRLFSEVYHDNPDGLPCVHHKDESTTNYALDNLEWCTYSENQRSGTVNERRGRAISEAVRGKPRPWIAEQKGKPVIVTDEHGNETRYPSGREAARQLGVRQSGVTYVLAGQRKTVAGCRVRYATNE